MKSQILSLPDDMIEIIHNSNLSNRSFLIRLTNYDNEKYEMRLNRESIVGLADFINEFLENS